MLQGHCPERIKINTLIKHQTLETTLIFIPSTMGQIPKLSNHKKYFQNENNVGDYTC